MMFGIICEFFKIIGLFYIFRIILFLNDERWDFRMFFVNMFLVNNIEGVSNF